MKVSILTFLTFFFVRYSLALNDLEIFEHNDTTHFPISKSSEFAQTLGGRTSGINAPISMTSFLETTSKESARWAGSWKYGMTQETPAGAYQM